MRSFWSSAAPRTPVPATIRARGSAHDLLFRRATPHDSLEDDAMIATRGRIERLVMRIQSAFLDHPNLALTLPAAEKRFGLDEATCGAVLAVLADARVLIERGGVYRRQFPGPSARRAA